MSAWFLDSKLSTCYSSVGMCVRACVCVRVRVPALEGINI